MLDFPPALKSVLHNHIIPRGGGESPSPPCNNVDFTEFPEQTEEGDTEPPQQSVL